MKKITFSLVLITMVISVLAQPPQAFKYQAVVRDATGEIISNQAVDVRISIHNATSGGTIVYQETFSETTNQFGLLNMEIGYGTTIIGSFSLIDWSAESKFIEIEIHDGGGYMSLGTSELFSVPYALYSNRSSDNYWGLNNSSIFFNSGKVGIGTTDPIAGLHLKGIGYPNSFMFLQSETGGDAGFRLYDGDEVKWHIFNKSTDDALYIYNADNTQTVFCADQSTGRVGIGTTTPAYRLEVNGKALIGNESKGIRFRNTGLMVDIESLGTDLALNYETGENTIMNVSSGNVGIGSSTPNAKLHVNDRIRVGEDPSYSTVYGELYHEGGGTGFKINAHAGGGSWADIYFQTNANTRMFIESAGNVGIGTTSPTSRLDVQGNVTIRDISTGDIAIQLGKGLDYAEGFDVSDDFEIEPGTILCIDTKNPGQLKISENPYDKTVAGIVAGANGLGSGVRLGTNKFDCDVALAGRVYCNTIATTEDIEPGDLLTSSSIPGFAMKVTDFEKAQGAIIGKAMENLKKGEKGQILVLVTLQ